MGTNYYCATGKKIKEICNLGCEHVLDEVLHIGKDSGGWAFSLQGIEEKNLRNLDDWIPVLQNATRIYSEYDETISVDAMIAKIKKPTRELNEKQQQEIDEYIKSMANCPYNKTMVKNGLLYIAENGIDENYNYSVDFRDFS